jgi:hypothetical protein
MTLQELKDELQASVSRQTLCTALAKLRLALKKVLRAAEQHRKSLSAVLNGACCKPVGHRIDSCSSTKPGPKLT